MTKSKNRFNSKTPASSGGFSSFAFFADIIYRIGLPGFIVLSIVVFVFMYASEDQKRQIIEKWVLFNNNSTQGAFTISVIIIAIIIYVVEAITFSKLRELDKQEIERLSEYKTKYQELSLRKPLSSSSN